VKSSDCSEHSFPSLDAGLGSARFVTFSLNNHWCHVNSFLRIFVDLSLKVECFGVFKSYF